MPASAQKLRAPERRAATAEPTLRRHADAPLAATVPALRHAIGQVPFALPNRTGLPDRLKTGIETVSGVSMADVRVHRNSGGPRRIGAHAYAQGRDIHLAPGKERHLAHEAWHIVQQKQGRVRPTGALGSGMPANDDPQLEAEADAMGARAAGIQPAAALGEAPHDLASPDAVPAAGPVQPIVVDDDDIGDYFEITTNDGDDCVGRLTEIRGGGWYVFSVDGKSRRVRGQINIHRRVDGPVSMEEDSSSSSSDEEEDDSDSGDESEDEKDTGSSPFVGYTTDSQPVNLTEFDIGSVALANKLTVAETLMRIRNSFRIVPRTLRLHYSFGSKTVGKGAPAFNTPSETGKDPQAMVSYRKGDYGKTHKKVGKDYDDWADELSDDEEDEKDKRQRATDILNFLDSDGSMKFKDLSSRQKASLGGLMTVALISDPLRTEHDSNRTVRNFLELLRARARGETTFHRIFGSKTTSEFLPARKGGSGQMRKKLREEDKQFDKEVGSGGRLRRNNCLINAICQAAHNRNATVPELTQIRYNLNNVGEMMVATQATVGVIRNALGINNEVIVRYPAGHGALDETFVGIPPTLTIYHTGAEHFQHNRPPFGHYN